VTCSVPAELVFATKSTGTKLYLSNTCVLRLLLLFLLCVTCN